MSREGIFLEGDGREGTRILLLSLGVWLEPIGGGSPFRGLKLGQGVLCYTLYLALGRP